MHLAVVLVGKLLAVVQLAQAAALVVVAVVVQRQLLGLAALALLFSIGQRVINYEIRMD